ncbi:ZapG family protein [Marinomonas mediterranea]|jgi:Protein of unknown function (DUF1043).|uniref:DUF1043 family protein n=1 Tax=Marinomonas mediterranea (strain ATCC 700492 / JCM 21426 / NBRC 103028 / MMB-1) TaxID=717774 RepID=F2K1B7_MARM1|nr:DUF1043 family protein [Marinomonas mediterranea]ADZ91048.1 protein of unknown function DUF1043 [Marinomonas mediterranea MMB-1]WCN09085.1 DUF1043 family protein [Marinomonas mediterranea]WCN13116.1 DUF1043 family protein [Marinomonas mediterranea]WCN17187.1 DUF1043 family protein [Marinomonas mediterranea MMB-1]
MNLEVFDIIVFLTGAVLGFIIAIVAKNVSQKGAQNRAASKGLTIDSVQQELDRKQVMVDDYFTATNEQLIMLEKRVSELRKSITKGAEHLSTATISAQPTSIDESDVEKVAEAQPPKDYASKEDSAEGMLTEGYGLKPQPSELEPNRSI